MAETRPKKPKGTYYRPPTVICDVLGVVKREEDSPAPVNHYTGTAEALIAAGLVTRDMLPGQPGRPFSAATYRPLGDVGSDFWWRTPGYMRVFRNLSGTFRVALTVSKEWREILAIPPGPPGRRQAAGDYYTRHGCLPDGAPRPSHLRLVWSAPPAQP